MSIANGRTRPCCACNSLLHKWWCWHACRWCSWRWCDCGRSISMHKLPVLSWLVLPGVVGRQVAYECWGQGVGCTFRLNTQAVFRRLYSDSMQWHYTVLSCFVHTIHCPLNSSSSTWLLSKRQGRMSSHWWDNLDPNLPIFLTSSLWSQQCQHWRFLPNQQGDQQAWALALEAETACLHFGEHLFELHHNLKLKNTETPEIKTRW